MKAHFNQLRRQARKKRIESKALYIVEREEYGQLYRSCPNFTRGSLGIHLTSYAPKRVIIEWDGKLVFEVSGFFPRIKAYRPDIVGWEEALDQVYQEHLIDDAVQHEKKRESIKRHEQERFPPFCPSLGEN